MNALDREGDQLLRSAGLRWPSSLLLALQTRDFQDL
ncbi:unannotated protein [freshwater metagenome]|uniref:Unannotated protein n=1 Tax=freshwater metagenome TaxID=449393 RepID=A0A6J6NGM3_9ZZZZ